MSRQEIPNADARFYAGGKIGVLLIHGFGGSPVSVDPWAQALHGEGFTVSVPQLPGHGTRAPVLERRVLRQEMAFLFVGVRDLRARVVEDFLERDAAVAVAVGHVALERLHEEGREAGFVLLAAGARGRDDEAALPLEHVHERAARAGRIDEDDSLRRELLEDARRIVGGEIGTR